MRKRDIQLAQQLSTGDQNAITELYSRFFSKIYSKCLRMIGDQEEAYDCANEVLWIVINKSNTFRGESSLSTFVFVITRNYCLDQLEKQQKLKLLVSTAQPQEIDDDVLIDREAIFQKIMDAMPEDDQVLLLDKYKRNMSISEIQMHLGLSTSAVKMRLLRARQNAQSMYQQYLAYSA